ncbi:MAG: stage 0 sporulation protein, partial [Lentisphaeria bacterium]|nr:stage 0 sporulation protein [Lentisphaeria bacterium]
MEKFYVLKLENGASLEVRAEESFALVPGDMCVFHRDFFDDMGEVVRELEAPSMTARPGDLPPVSRTATVADFAAARENLARERGAMSAAREWIATLGLPMKLINAHYSLDGKQVTIQFSADGRVDFRELVKALSRALSTRIELRQIGVRDESAIYGGIAVCGQALCCCRFLREFSSINVRMAKDQDLSLTPSSISGVCGRLKCCLKYEHAGYQEAERSMPRKGEYCETPAGRGRVTDRNILSGKVTVSFETGTASVFAASEVKVLRGERRPVLQQNGG